MSFLVLDIPEQNSDIAPWLERELVGLRLADLIAGLEVFQPEPAEEMELQDALGGQLSGVLERGLGALSEKRILNLLTHPRLLLELQERVFIDGGEYWEQVPVAMEHDQLVTESWKQVSNAVAPKATAAPASVAGGAAPSTRKLPWAAAFTAAALLLVAVFAWNRFAPAPASGWGWNRPGALADSGTPREYLLQLADGADDWFNKRPQTEEELATRIAQFRSGCETLIQAPHRPLAPEDRAWLVERCQAWSGKLGEHLAAVEAGGDVEAIRAEADATINKLIQALRTRAEQVA